jgi:hypothetical protein
VSFKTVPVLALSLGLGARGGLSVSAAGPASSTVSFDSSAYAMELEAVEGLHDRMSTVMQHCRDLRMAMQE